MRLPFALLAFAFAIPVASAQPVASCSYDDCALAAEGGVLSPAFVRGADSVRVAGGRLADVYYGPGLVPLVSAVPEAAAYARTYEQTRVPRLASVVASAVLVNLALWGTGDGALGFFDEGARPYLWAGAAISFGSGLALDSRGRRARDSALATYNGSLDR